VDIEFKKGNISEKKKSVGSLYFKPSQSCRELVHTWLRRFGSEKIKYLSILGYRIAIISKYYVNRKHVRD
jgi:hypothetical protein